MSRFSLLYTVYALGLRMHIFKKKKKTSLQISFNKLILFFLQKRKHTLILFIENTVDQISLNVCMTLQD